MERMVFHSKFHGMLKSQFFMFVVLGIMRYNMGMALGYITNVVGCRHTRYHCNTDSEYYRYTVFQVLGRCRFRTCISQDE